MGNALICPSTITSSSCVTCSMNRLRLYPWQWLGSGTAPRLLWREHPSGEPRDSAQSSSRPMKVNETWKLPPFHDILLMISACRGTLFYSFNSQSQCHWFQRINTKMPVDYSKWVSLTIYFQTRLPNVHQATTGDYARHRSVQLTTLSSRTRWSSATTRTSRSTPTSTNAPSSEPSRIRSTRSASSASTRSRP